MPKSAILQVNPLGTNLEVLLILTFCYLCRLLDCCYVLESLLFQVFSYIIHIVGISFIHVEQMSFSFGYFDW